MDFIRVTLVENFYQQGKKVRNIQRHPDYLLPVAGIKSISRKIGDGDIYHIYIREDFKPSNVEFEVGSAEAWLPKTFIAVLNELPQKNLKKV